MKFQTLPGTEEGSLSQGLHPVPLNMLYWPLMFVYHS